MNSLADNFNVALGRALVKQPKVLLLDEPLAALDKKLQRQFELMNLQSELNMTFIVVTHDQEEAMTLSSRIALMNKGEFRPVHRLKYMKRLLIDTQQTFLVR